MELPYEFRDLCEATRIYLKNRTELESQEAVLKRRLLAAQIEHAELGVKVAKKDTQGVR